MNEYPKRKPNRLKNFDYSSNGYYHITICSENHKRIFSEIVEDKIGINEFRPYPKLTEIGKICEETLLNLPKKYNKFDVYSYVIMPNHIHAVFVINANETIGEHNTVSLSTAIKEYKKAVSRQVGKSIWQKSFYDHIITEEKELENVLMYINENPIKWENDEYYL